MSKTSASGFIGFPNARKYLKAEWFKCFRAFGKSNPMKHDPGVFEITSPSKYIIISISRFQVKTFWTAHGFSEACESCEQALIAVSQYGDFREKKSWEEEEEKIVRPVLFRILSIIKTKGQLVFSKIRIIFTLEPFCTCF